MPDVIFPKLRGIKWGTRLAPNFNTTRMKSHAGSETSFSNQQQPLWKITLEYEFLSEKQPPPPNETTEDPVYSDLDTLLGFFCARRGAGGSFLFTGVNEIDLARFAVSGGKLGVGDGDTTDFQLVRSIGPEFNEIIQNPFGVPTFYLDGEEVAAEDVEAVGNGLYRFSEAPGAGSPVTNPVVTADFTFAYLCKFDDDQIELANFMAYFWELGSVPLITVKKR
ncbi:MAG: DUF2460 domain-containing protein [Acidobacteriota bacterium]|nr:DUF2460 domain-containing protein [Acidobacteriota bacterium]